MITNDKVSIKLIGITKKYTINHEKPTLMEKLAFKKNEVFYALKNINLTIKKGERVGIVGANGSGKTTLLKILAGITSPTSGSLKINGKIVSLIDLEAGFHPDLTGRQNIYLNGMLLGMSKDEIKNNIRKIINFAGIGKFIDAPLFTYSSGMKLRLGFSIAIHSNPDILILDENISVGDQDFNMKIKIMIDNLRKSQKIIITASHNLNYIQHNCDYAILMHKGQIIANSDTQTIIKKYRFK